MTKARALKKRYILFELRGPDLAEEPLKRALYAEALAFFGELGLSGAALKLVAYDAKSKKGIIRCERDYLERALGFLALLSFLGGERARLVALKSSGTLKSLGQHYTQSA
jgi:ribonuclease P/MRP protein subunit POP5